MLKCQELPGTDLRDYLVSVRTDPREALIEGMNTGGEHKHQPGEQDHLGQQCMA